MNAKTLLAWTLLAVLLPAPGLLAQGFETIAQEAYIKAVNTDPQDGFHVVGLSGDTLVVGAIQEDSASTGVDGLPGDNSAGDSGAAYVFTRSATGWAPQAYLKASNTEGGDNFGRSVAISGNTIAVGAQGEDSSAAGVGGDPSDNGAQSSGAVYVFARDGDTWTQQAYIKASNSEASDTFGTSVALDGDTLVVGAFLEDSAATGVDGDETDNSAASAGAVYVFVRNGTDWTQQAYLKASNAQAGDIFGLSVAISGDTIVVGARDEDSDANGVNANQLNNTAIDAGAAYVFVRNGSTWSQQAYLKAHNSGAGDWFGIDVDIEDDTVVVGAIREDSAATVINGNPGDSLVDVGAAYVYRRSGTSWTMEAYLKPSVTNADDTFGFSVGVSGEQVAVGSTNEASSVTVINGDATDNATNNAGAVHLFERSGATWSRVAYLKTFNTDANDSLGQDIAMDGGRIAASAWGESSAATGVDGDPNDNSAMWSGAVYLFTNYELWTDLGGGTPGSAGTPALAGSGSLVGGAPASVSLTNAPPGALALAWFSFDPTPFAALGGTVYAQPNAGQLLLVANGGGSAGGATTWPTGMPTGTQVWFQFVVQDASVPAGLTLSNGLVATTP